MIEIHIITFTVSEYIVIEHSTFNLTLFNVHQNHAPTNLPLPNRKSAVYIVFDSMYCIRINGVHTL